MVFKILEMREEILKLAIEKGYKAENINDLLNNDGEHIFILRAIERWLQKKHFIYIAIMPRFKTSINDFIFNYFIMDWQGSRSPFITDGYQDYDDCYKRAIMEALKLINDTSTTSN